MEENLILPKILQLPGQNVIEILNNFLVEMEAISESGRFFYADQCILKTSEYLDTIVNAEKGNSFLLKLKDVWIKTLSLLMSQSGLHFEINLRVKSLTSLFSKMNRVMLSGSGKSLDSIHDLLGIEIIVYTNGLYDSYTSIVDCYKAANIAINFFTLSQFHKGDYFLLHPGKGKNQANVSNEEDLQTLKSLNPHIYIPESSMIISNYSAYIRDYVANPKITTGYQGIQFALVSQHGTNLEVQIKTQPMRDYLDSPESPGAHALHKESFEIVDNSDIPQFDLSYCEEDLLKRIPGFRPKGSDRSGIIDPIKWNLRKNPF